MGNELPLKRVNFTCVSGDKAANLAMIEVNMREAAAQGVNILAFPEEALTGCGGCAPYRDGADHSRTLVFISGGADTLGLSSAGLLCQSIAEQFAIDLWGATVKLVLFRHNIISKLTTFFED